MRELPNWDTITGLFPVGFAGPAKSGPSAKQVEAWLAFNKNLNKLDEAILDAIAGFYAEFREDEWSHRSNEEKGLRAATWPEIEYLSELFEVIELSYINIAVADGGNKRSPAIGLVFNWANEHGIGVVVRDGHIEEIGYADTAMFH